ncbi:hypothetical protein ACS0TY_002547 [Phlomoides rotata]
MHLVITFDQRLIIGQCLVNAGSDPVRSGPVSVQCYGGSRADTLREIIRAQRSKRSWTSYVSEDTALVGGEYSPVLPSSRRPQSRHRLPRPSEIGIKKFIFVSAAKYCVDIAIHQHGCCVLRRCICHSTGELREKLIAEISANGLLLAQDAYGNYVVQFILELRIPSALSKLTYQFEGNYVNLSRQKFSSHVVEKCLAVCNNEDDLSAQLRSLKKCMKEAEEEQYRVSDMTSTNFSIDQMQATDSNLRFKLEQEEKMRQQEHQLLAEEQARVSTLIIQKQELEEKLASISKRTSDRGGRRGCMVFFPELFTVFHL